MVYFYINMIDCRALRHFIFMEISAYNSYRGIGFNINYWRTKSGLEVDFILGNGEVALEIKGSGNIQNRDMHALKIFSQDYSPRRREKFLNREVVMNLCFSLFKIL